MAREATGARKRVYNKTRSGQLAPEMQGAIDRARPILSIEEFVRGLELEASFGDEGVGGLSRSRQVLT